jgi:hypothetical protein
MKLREYYKQTVAKNDSKTGGWSKYYYGILSEVIKEKDYKLVAEVGIGYGTHAKQLLRETSLEHLFLIDPMTYYPNDLFATDIITKEAETPGNNFNEMVSLIKEELSPWKERYTWFRKPSLDIRSEEIPDSYLDCVFIDGDHSYMAVLNDLRFWWNKVRQDGQILGDDYWMGDVKRAVEDFSREKNLTISFYENKVENYKIYSFTKN